MLASLTKKPNPCSSDIKTAKNFKNSEAAKKEKEKKKVNVVSTSEHVQIPSQNVLRAYQSGWQELQVHPWAGCWLYC